MDFALQGDAALRRQEKIAFPCRSFGENVRNAAAINAPLRMREDVVNRTVPSNETAMPDKNPYVNCFQRGGLPFPLGAMFRVSCAIMKMRIRFLSSSLI